MSGDSQELPSAPHRVLMTTDAVGGVWQYSLHLARGLGQRGVETLLVSFGPKPTDEQKEQAKVVPGLNLLESDLALEWMPHPWEDIDRAGDWLLSLEKDFRPELIHLNGYSFGVLPWKAPTVVVAHSCVYSWWKAVRGDTPTSDWHEYKARVTRGLQSCTVAIAPSLYMADAVVNEYGISREKIRVIHNSSTAASRRKVTKQPYAIAAGRYWDPAKNLQLLDGIAPELDWQLRVAGGSGRGRAESDDSNVWYLGALPHHELLNEFERASLFLHPALYEPFGLAVLEAASANCCLALSDIPSLRELWQGAAVFIDPRDPQLWIFEVNNLMRDFELRESLARAAVIRSRRYQSEEMLDRYFNLYQLLLEGKPNRTNGVAA